MLKGLTIMPFGNQRTGFNNPLGPLGAFQMVPIKSGWLFYNGTPALGNLAASIATQSGTDRFGNVYVGGPGGAFTGYDVSASKIVSTLSGLGIAWQSHNLAWVGSSGQVTWRPALSNAQQPTILLQPGTADGSTDATIYMQSASQDGTKKNVVLVSTGSLVNLTFALLEIQGALAPSGGVHAFAGTATGAVPAGAEDWITIAPGNLWSNSGSGPNLKYRMLAGKPNTVEVIGDLATGTVTDGTTIATLPAAYHPATGQAHPVAIPTGHATTPGNERITVTTGGAIQCFGMVGLVGRVAMHFDYSLTA